LNISKISLITFSNYEILFGYFNELFRNLVFGVDSLNELLIISLCAVLSRAEDFEDISEYGKKKRFNSIFYGGHILITDLSQVKIFKIVKRLS